ncbi:MAG: hypothetical protein HC789_07500 [Microcoleus sp. CSU_2_2]|nr:hypothetical protein [Microcoleus sp. SU_5_3]NJS10229.1 hypothetical protein [Microcoleus sp. CSU_2_2]
MIILASSIGDCQEKEEEKVRRHRQSATPDRTSGSDTPCNGRGKLITFA